MTGKEFTPILFSPDYELVQLADREGVLLADVEGVLLYARDTGPGDQRDFSTHGLGLLTDTITSHCEEVLNGLYVLEMTYPVDGAHFSEIGLRSIIIAQPNYTDRPQAFRVYHIEKPINLICTIYAEHISYDLSGIPVAPFSVDGIQAALRGLTDHAMEPVPFTLSTSRSTSSPFAVDVPSSIRSWLGGKAGSLLDVYGGEWHWDNYTATLENSRGSDRGVVISYGKNLIDLTQEERCDAVYTGVLAYWQSTDGEVVYGSIQRAPGTYAYTRIYTLDCSTDFEEMPDAAQLDAKAADYIEANNVGVPKISLTLDYAQVGDLAERVDLGDTVTIRFEKLGVEAKAKCIRTKWNVLLGRYDEVEFGDARSTLADTIHDLQDAASGVKDQVKAGLSVYDSKAAEFKNLIAQSYGLYQSEITDPVLGGTSYALHNMSEYEDSTFAMLFNASGLFMLTRATASDEWTVSSGTAADGSGLVKVLTAVGIKASWINIGGSGENGTLLIYDTSDNVIGQWGAGGIRIYKGSIEMTSLNPTTDVISLSRTTSSGGYNTTIKSRVGAGFFTAQSSSTESTSLEYYRYSVSNENIFLQYCFADYVSAANYAGEYYQITMTGSALMFEDGVYYTDGGEDEDFRPSHSAYYDVDGYHDGSDIRLKENVIDMPEYAIDMLKAIRPVEYELKGTGRRRWGFIAQEVLEAEEKSGAEVSMVGKDSKGYYSINYQTIIPVLTKAIQEQQTRIDGLEARLEALEERLFADGR